jgi:hypothetical protein
MATLKRFVPKVDGAGQKLLLSTAIIGTPGAKLGKRSLEAFLHRPSEELRDLAFGRQALAQANRRAQASRAASSSRTSSGTARLSQCVTNKPQTQKNILNK